jgi:orotate phosphoribosyltransferase-like protein
MKSQISQKQRSTILGLSSKGLKAPEIAEKLGLSMPTVRSIIIRHERADSWTRKRITPFEKARIAEAQSKAALSESWVSYSHTFPNAAAKHW